VHDVVAQHGGGTVLSTLLAYVTLYAGLLICYVGTLRYMATKPAASLIASQQQYPEQKGAVP